MSTGSIPSVDCTVQVHDEDPFTIVLYSFHRPRGKLGNGAYFDESRQENLYRYLYCLSNRSDETLSFSGSSSNSGNFSGLGGICPPLPSHFSSMRYCIAALTVLRGMRWTAGCRNPMMIILWASL